jgi:hypothetical protein
VDGVFGSRERESLPDLQQRAWEHVRKAIGQGQPCYGWELEIPEYYVINGYDDVGYLYSGPGCDEGRGPKPWQELGDTGIGMVEIYSVMPGEVADDATVIREALAFALEHARNPDRWILPRYRAGLEGYETWLRSIETGTASAMGMSYNAAVWEECRRHGAEFLVEEAKGRLDGALGSLLDEAARHYRTAARQLKVVCDQYPPSPHHWPEGTIQVGDRSRAAADALRKAQAAEADGLRVLTEIVGALDHP